MTFFSTAPSAASSLKPSPLVCEIPNLPAPSILPTCQEEWNRFASSNVDTVVHSLAWHGQHLAAVTSSGNVCLWNIPNTWDEDDLDQVEQMELYEKIRRPLVNIQMSTGVLYSIQFVTTSPQQTLLIVSGDEGVLGYDWKEWLKMMEGGPSSPPPEVKLHCKPHRSLSTVEINDFSVSNNYIWGAAGDANGYKWDMETQRIVSEYPSANRGYLHTIQCMPNSNTVLMGGEDGFLGIWDGHHDKLIDNVNLLSALEKDSELVERDDCISGNTALTANTSSTWISNIQSPSEHWWTICGGIQHSATRSTSPSPAATSVAAGGHVTSWHAPTRSLVAGCLTRETPQYSCSTPATLVTVANEGVVSHWTPSRLQRTGRVWCSPPSCFAAAIGNSENNDEGVLAVGGVGNQVDIFDNVMGNKSYSLTL